MKDNCEMPLCQHKGVPGNENMIRGMTMCDYCHAIYLVLNPPFVLYRDMDIADATGHICTAESPEIAKAILHILTNAFPDKAEPSPK